MSVPREDFVCNWCLNTGVVVKRAGYYDRVLKKFIRNAIIKHYRCLHCNVNMFDKRSAKEIYENLDTATIERLIIKNGEKL
jgi:hypothetical protein